jgi:glycosyltransferase involved in cell wall biosynthesis
MNSKLIDIICPVYNQEKNIKNFLLPFLHMDLNNVNIILIDDGSTDNTPSIIDEIISVNKGVPFHYFKKQWRSCIS